MLIRPNTIITKQKISIFDQLKKILKIQKFFKYFLKVLYTIFIFFSLGLLFISFFILSKSICYISVIIKNIFIVITICTFGLDITAYINRKAGTLITLQYIS